MFSNSMVFCICLLSVTLLQLWIYVSYVNDVLLQWLMDAFDDLKPYYDFIIGGGSAGCVLAARLSQEPGRSVLLLEAGPKWSSFLADIPVLTPLLQGSVLDWQYRTVPQSNACFALRNNASAWPRGRLLGGSARFNNLVYTRGHASDYDGWGDPDWSYARVVRYFRRLETQSAGGGVPVSHLPWATPLAAAVLDAGRQLGYPIANLNTDEQTGFMGTPVNMVVGRRFSVDKAFLDDNKRRTNLKIVTHALVDKVLFHRDGEAYGVQYLRFGKTRHVRARKGVILSAGTVSSPAVLMRSGIGPRQHLRSLQIPVLRDLEVGGNLQDHVTTGLDLILLNTSLPLGASALASLSSAYQFFMHQSGPWTSPGCEVVALLHSNIDAGKRALAESPDLQLMVVPAGASSDAGAHLHSNFHLSSSVWRDYFAPLSGQQVASLLPVVLHPRSRGEVRLRSRDPRSAPLIDPRYLSHPADVDVLLRGVRLVQRLVGTPPMQALGASLVRTPLPGCEALPADSDLYWSCYMRHITLTAYHPVGTCRMGPSSHPAAVVSFDLRVHGTRKLYVADASVIPSMLSGNIHAAVLMVAERAAELVVRHTASRELVCCLTQLLLPPTTCPASTFTWSC